MLLLLLLLPQVVRRHQQDYKWLMAGNCGSEACEDLWLPTEESE
jgi:hypothetical protein